MNKFKIFAFAALSLATLAGCGDKAEEIPFVLDFSVDDGKITEGKLVIEDEAYLNYVILAANTNDWVVDYTPKGDWLTITKLAEGESNRVKVEAKENTTFDARTANVTFKYSGKQVGSFEVMQLGSAAILEVEEGSREVNLPSVGQTFEIALIANTAFTVSYEPEDLTQWISEIVPAEPDEAGGTRAIGSAKKTLMFRASENEELPGRSGEIVFTAGDIVCRATVSQLGNVPDILVDETPVELAYNDTQLEIEVMSNVAYDVAVVYTDGDGWLTPAPQGFGMVNETVKYTVAENTMAEQRSATVVFTYVDTENDADIRKEVPVTQEGHLVMSVSETFPAVSEGSIPLGFPASTFTVKLASNTVSAPAATVPAWLAQEGDAVYADGVYTYTFSFGDNNGFTARTGSISFSIYGATGATVAVSQAVGVFYEDQIKVVNATATQASGSYSGLGNIYNGVLTDNWDSNYSTSAYGETVTLTFELEDTSEWLSRIVYYKKGNNEISSHSMTGFELLTSDTADGEFVSHGSYTVEPAVYQQPREIVLREPVSNTGFVRMVITVPSNGWLTCAEMQFFGTAVQNDEYAGVVSMTLPSGTPAEGNYVPAAGENYQITLNTNLDFPFEYSEGVVITEAPTPFALPERAERTWDITIPANTEGVWKQHTVAVKTPNHTFATYVVPQAFDASKVSVDANSTNNATHIARIMNLEFSEIWESNYGYGTGHVYTKPNDIIREDLPVTITFTFPEGVPSVSGMTICPRNGNGDWTKFKVTAITTENPTGTVVCTYDSGRIQTAKYVEFSSVTENVTELFIEITGTSSETTATVKELVIWE